MRTKATIYSFFLVFALYLVYGWAVVPLVLPNPGGNNADRSDNSIGNRSDTTREEIEFLLELLPQDGWERDPSAPIHMLRDEQTIVLFGKDKPDGKRLRLEPCTIIFLPNPKEQHDDEESESPILQSVVLRTQKHAEIEFDRDFDLRKMSLPKIVCGRLFGKVTIKSTGQDSTEENNFNLVTEDIEITESPGLTKIETLKDVEFTFGSHSGAGTGLTLEIVQSDLTQPQSERELNSVKFQRLKSLHLAFPEASIDVTCRGPFAFAFNPAEQGWTAYFNQNVEMVRNNPGNIVDRLNAEVVRLTLKPVEGEVIGNKTKRLDNLEPAKFVAQGKPGQNGQPPTPARLSVKQGGDVTLVGDEIFFDLRENCLLLSTRQGAGASPYVEMNLADQYKIQSEHVVQYTLGKKGAFGKLISEGKGNLTGKTGEGTSAKDIYLSWNKMNMEPHPLIKDQIVLTLSKGINAQMAGFGTMTADTLDLYCIYAPSSSTDLKLSGNAMSGTGGQKNNFLLDQALVRGKDGEKVRFETTSGICIVKQLQIFFSNVVEGKVSHSRWMPQMFVEKPPVAPGSQMASTPIRQVQHLEPLALMQPLPPHQPGASPSAPVYGNNLLPNSRSAPAATPKRDSVETQNLLGITSTPNGGKFEMTGDLMRMRVQMQNGQSSAENIDIEGSVYLKETIANGIPTNSVPNGAIEISGDTVRIWNPADPTTQITILGHATGGDAVFKGKGVELRAKELNISRPDNTFWSPGAGRLVVNTAQLQAPGISTANTNDKLIVEWNEKMRCDGKVLQFYGQAGRNNNRVWTMYQTTSMWCDFMEMELNRHVMFFDDRSPVEPKAVVIRCVDDVHFQDLQRDTQGKQKSINRARVAKLHYNVEKDYFVAHGPGELSSMFLGTGQGFDTKNLAPGDLAGGNLAGNPGKETLNYLAVWFQDTMQGILLGNSKKVDIRGQVEAVYYPAVGWEDTIDRANFGAARKVGYTLDCEQLQIDEVPNPLDLSQSFMELTASNNAVIDGRGIFGKAQTIKYNQAKSMVYLEGNVDLRTATQGQQARAKSIHYNIETGRIEFQAQGLNIGQ